MFAVRLCGLCGVCGVCLCVCGVGVSGGVSFLCVVVVFCFCDLFFGIILIIRDCTF